MRTILTLLLLVAVSASSCGKGGLLSGDSQCFYPVYIEGCVNYGYGNGCQQCEYSTIWSSQTTSLLREAATTSPRTARTAAVSSITTEPAVNALLDCR
jgi:hypothetical protein